MIKNILICTTLLSLLHPSVFADEQKCKVSKKDLVLLEDIKEMELCSSQNLQGLCVGLSVVAGSKVQSTAKKVSEIQKNLKSKINKVAKDSLRTIEQALDADNKDRVNRSRQNLAKYEKAKFALRNFETLQDDKLRAELKAKILAKHNSPDISALDKNFVKKGHIPTSMQLETIEEFEKSKKENATSSTKKKPTSIKNFNIEMGARDNPYNGRTYYDKRIEKEISNLSKARKKDLRLYIGKLNAERKLHSPVKNFVKMKRQILNKMATNPSNLRASSLAKTFNISPNLANFIDTTAKMDKKRLNLIKTMYPKISKIRAASVAKIAGKGMVALPLTFLSVSKAACAQQTDHTMNLNDSCDPVYKMDGKTMAFLNSGLDNIELNMCSEEIKQYYRRMHKIYVKPLKFSKSSCQGKEKLTTTVEQNGKNIKIETIMNPKSENISQLKIQGTQYIYDDEGKLIQKCQKHSIGELCTPIDEKNIAKNTNINQFAVERKIRRIGPILNSCCNGDKLPEECSFLNMNSKAVNIPSGVKIR